MHSLRKIVYRRSWIMATVVIALLVQIQQTLACDIMIDSSVPASEHCYKHETTDKKEGNTTHSCCDFSEGFVLKNGHCHDGHETVINQQLLGKLNLDIQPLIVIVNIQDLFYPSYLTRFHYIPDSNSSLAGTQIYLSTQRLRI